MDGMGTAGGPPHLTGPLEQTEKKARWVELTLTMLKIGLFTFGGGWSIVAQMQKEFVEKRGRRPRR